MESYTYRLQIEPVKEGGFVVKVPALPGCVTQGETYDEAVVKAQECIEGFLEALVKAKQPIPRDPLPTRQVDRYLTIVKASLSLPA